MYGAPSVKILLGHFFSEFILFSNSPILSCCILTKLRNLRFRNRNFCMLLHEVWFWSNFRATFLMLRAVLQAFGHSVQQCCVRSCALGVNYGVQARSLLWFVSRALSMFQCCCKFVYHVTMAMAATHRRRTRFILRITKEKAQVDCEIITHGSRCDGVSSHFSLLFYLNLNKTRTTSASD